MLRTAVYVDGYNLYYSRLQGGAYKWLDLVALFEHIIRAQTPDAKVTKLKYFTAPVKASYARHGVASDIAQTAYHLALKSMYAERLEIIKGFHVLEPMSAPALIEGQPPNKDQRVKAWHIEEKQTDVNMALQTYRDAVSGLYDQIVVCSNDSDVEPVMRLIRQDKPELKIGLVLPLRVSEGYQKRIANKRLTPLAHWVCHQIHDSELAASQLPAVVPTKKRPARKPLHWNAQ